MNDLMWLQGPSYIFSVEFIENFSLSLDCWSLQKINNEIRRIVVRNGCLFFEMWYRFFLHVIGFLWKRTFQKQGITINGDHNSKAGITNKKKMWFFWTLPVLLQRCCSTCLVCVHTLTPREKSLIFNEHPVSTFQAIYSIWNFHTYIYVCLSILNIDSSYVYMYVFIYV